MNIKKNAIVSNSEMIKNYKTCRDKAEDMGKVFIIKRNHPDAVLFSIDEYDKRSPEIERQEAIEKLDTPENDLVKDNEVLMEKDSKKPKINRKIKL